MADRAEFLARIRIETAKGRAHRVAVNPEATHERAYVGGGVDPVASLIAEWRAVGGLGDRVSGEDAVREFVKRFVEEHSIRRAIRWSHPLLERLEIDSMLKSNGVTVATWDELASQPAESRWKRTFDAQLGITSVNWAIAETGSLALCSDLGQGRSMSLLPPVFLAILEPSQIVPDLFDAFDKLESRKHDLPSNVVFVTGPSKTGDIELKLTTGVHGPGTVRILVVEP